MFANEKVLAMQYYVTTIEYRKLAWTNGRNKNATQKVVE